MLRSMRSSMRFAVMVLLFAALAPAASLLTQGHTPYGSALSTFGPSAASAAPGCSMQICNKPKGSRPADCLATSLMYNCSKSGGHCTSTAC